MKPTLSKFLALFGGSLVGVLSSACYAVNGTPSVMAAAPNQVGTVVPHVCNKEEKVAFSCLINKKRLSLCVSSLGGVSYRFGRKGEHPELEISTTSEKAAHAITVTEETATMGGGHFLIFEAVIKNENTEYSLNIAEIADAEGGFSGNVLVTPLKTKPATLTCRKGSVIADVEVLQALTK